MLNKLFREVHANMHGSGQTFADAERYDPYKSFKFEVEISGNMVFAKAGFQNVSGLKMNTEVIEYREGGDALTVSKTPGLTSFEPITLSRGMSEDGDMWEWASKLFDYNNPSTRGKHRANMKIKLKDRQGNVVRAWNVPNCWVSEYSTGDFDAMGNNVMIETIVVQHEGFYRDR
jgi:phage tail-like protein